PQGSPSGGYPVPNYPAPYAPRDTPPALETDEGWTHVPNSVFCSTEYLLYFINSQPVPFPLITSGTPAALGQLGNSGTTILYGQDNLKYNPSSGLRITAGKWFGDNS